MGESDHLRGVAAHDAGPVTQEFGGDAAAPGQAAGRDRVKNPRPSRRLCGGRSQMHGFHLCGGWCAEIDKNGVGDYSMVGFTLRNTLSDFGSVARGVCRVG